MPARIGKQVTIVACLALTLASAGCIGTAGPRTVDLSALESAPLRSCGPPRWQIVNNTEPLRPLAQPLSRRLSLIQIRSAADWTTLTRAVPDAGPRPDFRHGMVVGLVSEAGLPLSGGWPMAWDAVRVCQGGGLLEAHFNAGNYLPDGVTYLATAYVPDLRAVLAVDVDGIRYYPPQ